MRCVVVGAGIIGATVAFRLAQRGAAVTLVERGLPGAGTSGTSFAWANASSKEPYPYFALNAAGVAGHARLATELGDAPWLLPTGNLEWEIEAIGAERLTMRAARLADWGYRVQRLSAQEVARLEPDLVLGDGAPDVVYYPDESCIYPSLYLACVLRAAREHGATLRLHESVTGIATSGGRVSGVALQSGTMLPADVVLSCCGRWTPEILQSVGIELPLVSPATPGSEAVGLLVRTGAVAADVRRAIHPPGLAIRPDGGGRLLIHGDAFDRVVAAGSPEAAAPAAAARLVETVRPFVRYMDDARVDSAAIGIRPIPADGVSVAGWVPAVDGLYVIVTHSGVTLAPILAELATGEVHGSVEPLLAWFRPARLLQNTSQRDDSTHGNIVPRSRA